MSELETTEGGKRLRWKESEKQCKRCNGSRRVVRGTGVIEECPECRKFTSMLDEVSEKPRTMACTGKLDKCGYELCGHWGEHAENDDCSNVNACPPCVPVTSLDRETEELIDICVDAMKQSTSPVPTDGAPDYNERLGYWHEQAWQYFKKEYDIKYERPTNLLLSDDTKDAHKWVMFETGYVAGRRAELNDRRSEA